MPPPGNRPRIAVPLGDPHGIGPEIAIKAALDPEVRRAALPVLVGDDAVIRFYAAGLGSADALARLVGTGAVAIAPVAALAGAPQPGVVSAAAGAATVAYARQAIAMAGAGTADAVVAAPHNETAVAQAGIRFSGYPGLLAEATGTEPGKVFLMLVSPRFRIAHVTLHVAVRTALAQITVQSVRDAARAAAAALGRMGFAQPRLAAFGINPHAGENGLFGDEDERITRPAVAAARRDGIDIEGPLGADVLLAENRHDGYLAMFHDQGHIPVKLEGRGNSFALSIGTPVLFSSVAHGSAHDIAGSGKADSTALAGTIRQLAAMLKKTASSGRNGQDHADGT